VVLTVQQQVLEKLLEYTHGEHGVIQIGLLAESLLEVPQQGERVRSVDLLGKLKDALQLDDQSREVQAIQACAQTCITQMLVDIVVLQLLLRCEAAPRQLRFSCGVCGLE